MIKKWINSAKKNEFVKREISRFKLIKAEPNPFKKILKYFWEWARACDKINERSHIIWHKC